MTLSLFHQSEAARNLEAIHDRIRELRIEAFEERRAINLVDVCEYCHCSEHNPCRLASGDQCGWFNRQRTVCTAPKCLNKYFRHCAEERPRKLKRA